MSRRDPTDYDESIYPRNTPRSERIPFREAVYVMSMLATWYDAHPEYGVDGTHFLNVTFPDAMSDASIDADAELRALYETDNVRSEQAMHVAFTCALAALRAVRDGNEPEAWSYAADARECMMFGWFPYAMHDSPFSVIGKRAAAVRHAENRALKQQAIETYLDGDFTSKDAAAEYIAGKVVPVKFRTVREWLKGVTKES